jgi:hypothetical protein
MDLNDRRCSPPLLNSEVRLIAESAAQYEPNAVTLAPASKDSPRDECAGGQALRQFRRPRTRLHHL